MTTSNLQNRLHAVVVGHVDGAGRSVVWQADGIKADAPSVRQGAVLPPRTRFVQEPGWLLRQLPSKKWLLLAGGTQHPELADTFGRSGIFHGAGVVASQADMGVVLAAPEPTALCLELAHLQIERRRAPSSHVRSAEVAAGKHGAMKSKLIASRVPESRLEVGAWREVQQTLRSLGLRPFSAPVNLAEGTGMSWGQPVIEAKKLDAAIALDGAVAAARKILVAWSGQP
jgi:hypothetical protein